MMAYSRAHASIVPAASVILIFLCTSSITKSVDLSNSVMNLDPSGDHLVHASSSGATIVYVASYSSFIPVYLLHEETGLLQHLFTVSLDPNTQATNPSWLTVSKDHRYLYAVNEIEDYNGEYSGAVSSFSIHPDTHQLTFINRVSSFGADPCHSHFEEKEGKSYLYLSNYCSGTLASITLNEDGSLGEVVQVIDHNNRTESTNCDGAHVHEVITDNTFAYSIDLGLDQLFQYEIHNGSLTYLRSLNFQTGSGPRHIIIHPILNYAFVVRELDSTVSTLSYNRHSGEMKLLTSTSTLLPNESSEGMAAAEILLSGCGKFVYVSNRDISEPNKRRSSVAVFRINVTTGELTLIQQLSSHGIHPRHIQFSSTFQYLLVANKVSNNLVVFKVDRETGRLSQTGEVVTAEDIIAPSQVLVIKF